MKKDKTKLSKETEKTQIEHELTQNDYKESQMSKI